MKVTQRITVIIFFLALFLPSLAFADAVACRNMLDLRLPQAEVIAAEAVSKGMFEAPDGRAYAVPDFCRVQGLIKLVPQSAIHFEVWLPLSKWNGRYQQHGAGSLGGAINYQALSRILNENTVAVATDDGHVRDQDGGATWARDDQKIVDVFELSLKATYDRAMTVVRQYYHRRPQYRYFAGCSGGGRQAFMAAQRYPQDWDGILAGAPGHDSTRLYATFAAYGKLWRQNPEGRIAPQKLPAIQRAALAACDLQAHVVDGIAGDPRFCRPNPDMLACDGVETDNCLTAPQRQMLKTLYDGIADKETGEILYSGFMPTFENISTGSWAQWVTGEALDNSQPPSLVFLGNRFFRNFVYKDPAWDVAQFDYTHTPVFARNRMIKGRVFSALADSNEADITALEKAGTKLIVYEGWGDPGVLPADVIRYHQQVIEEVGGVDRVKRFYRLFMVPGMLHCGGGPGANAFGQPYVSAALKNDAEHHIMRALEDWVEKGTAPDRIIAAKYEDDNRDKAVAFTRPLCPFPQVAQYKGFGSKAVAAHFRCTENKE